MLFIRISPLYAKIFTDWPGEFGNYVNFASDDAIYHMRFVHNTLHNFPFRIFFDPFTHFPFGSHIAFGPLFTFIIATVALIVGLGHPSPELVNHVAAYIPPVMGALCLIPLYFIGRKIFNKTTALLAAFVLTFLPGEFLNRSTLGFVDHHVAEVLFSTTTCAFLIYALAAAKSQNFSFANTKHKNNRNTLLFGLLTGISFGLFTLVWQGAMMFGAIFLIFFIAQLLIDNINNNNTDYLLSLIVLTYVPPSVISLPYILVTPITLYPANNILILVVLLAIFTVCYLLHIALRQNKLTRQLYPLALCATFALIVFALNKLFPQVYVIISDGCKLLFHPTPGMLTVSEVHPTIIGHNGQLTTQLFWLNLYWTMPLAILGLCCLGYRCYKKQHPAEVFLSVWSLTIVAATCAQIRFNYYLAINAALLSGYGIYFLLNLIDSFNLKKKLYLKLKKISFSVLFFILAILIIDPMIMLLMDKRIPSGVQISRQWYDTLIWLKNNTPDPQGKSIDKQLPYFGYYPVPKNLGSPYNYPKNAYGVMSWWDVGHQITYVAQRIPNSTPFQQGITEKDGTSGSALFFTSTDEKKAVRNLDEMGSRYVVINGRVANQINGMGIWCNDTKDWIKTTTIKPKNLKKPIKIKVPIESQKFLQSMLSRLYYDDSNGLQHFRLIYETDGNYFVRTRRTLIKNSQNLFNSMQLTFKDHHEAIDATKKINQIYSNKDETLFAYSALPPTKWAKVFEKVKGATIDGKAPDNTPDNTKVKLSIKLKTKYGRIFTYKQTTKVKNGKYKFVVSYPTARMKGDGYSYDIRPITNYRIQINDQITKVFISEKAVMLGKKINVPWKMFSA